MRLVRLTDGCMVNPEEVMELKVPDYGGGVTVRMKGGVGHFVPSDYGKTAYDTMRRLQKELEGKPEPTKERP